MEKVAPKRILFVLSRGGLGGIERHVECLLHVINREQFEVAVCILFHDGPVADNIRGLAIPVFVLNGHSGHDLGLFGAFRKVLADFTPDIVHLHEAKFIVFLALWSRPSVPVILSVHCSIDQDMQKTKFNILMRTLGRRVDFYLPVSMATLNCVQQYWGIKLSKMNVFYNPILLPTVNINKAEGRKLLVDLLGVEEPCQLVGMVGRMVEQKDWPAFLEVCQGISTQCGRVHFVAIGGGELLDELKRSAAAEQLGKLIHWLGPRNDVKVLIDGLDLFMLTSKHEELPTTLLEAFSHRVPVAGFVPRGGVEEIVALDSSAAAFIEDRDCSQLSKVAVALLKDEKTALSQAERAYRLTEKYFDAKRTINSLEMLYKSTLLRCKKS